MSRRYLTYAIASWCGFHTMVIELLAGRLMSPYFGSSVYVWGSVIFVCMLGLALGYLFGGIASTKSPTFGKLCLFPIAISLASVPAATIADPILNRIFDAIEDPRFSSLLGCLILFLVPIIFCGMVSPYAIRILARDTQSSGHSAGTLYFVSTVGSCIGTILTAFYLVLWLEVDQIIFLTAGIALALSLVCGITNFVAVKKDVA